MIAWNALFVRNWTIKMLNISLLLVLIDKKSIKFDQLTWGFFVFITAVNKYGERKPLSVYLRAYIYFMQNLDAHDLVSYNVF